MRLQHIILLIPLIHLLNGCGGEVNENKKLHTLKASENNFTLIRDGLYEDSIGRLFHRTLDVSAIGNSVYRYNNYLREDTLINGEITFNTPLISEVVDKETFRLVSIDSTKHQLQTEYYKDKNNNYFLLVVADGGMLHKTLAEER
jgi:hypothetical protein